MKTFKKYTVILNSTNKNPNNDNEFVYQFPTNVKFGANDKVGLEAISIYNSFFNISSDLQNNSIQITFRGDLYNFIIPDGNYSVSQLDYWLKSRMALNNLYLTTTTGDIVYFLELGTEPTRYAVTITAYPIPTSAQATNLGYTKPAGATWSYPATAETPLITIQNKMSTLLGFNLGSYPSTVQTTTQIFLSSSTPQLSPHNSIVLTCSLLFSKFSQLPTLLSSVPLDKGYGSLISNQYSNPALINISAGYHNSIVISFYDQKYKKLTVIDNDVIIRLIIEIET